MRWITLCLLAVLAMTLYPIIESNMVGAVVDNVIREHTAREAAPDVVPIHPGQSKMPARFINKQIRDLKVSEEGFVYTNYIRVDVSHYVWIDIDAVVTDGSKSIFVKIKVTKLENGYGITIPHDCDEKWTTTMTSKQYASMDYCPVMKLTIAEGDPS